MFATKETFVLTVAAMLIALVVTAWSRVHARRSWESLVEFIPWRDVAIGSLAVLAVWLLFFSSFLTNSRGLLDSVLTYLPWLKRAAGDSPHIHPWYFYFQRLGWFHPVRGPVWSEALILVLAVVGMIGSFLPGRPLLIRFLTIYSIVLATIYSIISYKTPWCLLNFYLGLLLLAGVGGAFLIELVRKKIAQLTIVALLLAGTVQLTIQSWRASYLFAADRRNPYVYAQTVPDILNLVERVNGIAEVSTNGFETVVKVIAPESDYWPLPWYLRRFEHVGWYSELPADPFAPIIIVSSDLDARLDDKSDRKWIMAGMTELRPTKFLELYVELELWKKYVEALQPPPEE
jgi:predicted membrane-bound mannosyltransferase